MSLSSFVFALGADARLGDLMAGINKSLLPRPEGISIRPCKCLGMKSLVGFTIFNGEGEDLGCWLELLLGLCFLLGVVKSLEGRRCVWLLFIVFLFLPFGWLSVVLTCFDSNSVTGLIDKEAPGCSRFVVGTALKELAILLFVEVPGIMFCDGNGGGDECCEWIDDEEDAGEDG